MANSRGKKHLEEESESVFVSMTDIMISILFIIMIIMAFFAKSVRDSGEDTATLLELVSTLSKENEELRAELIIVEARLQDAEDTEKRLAALRDDNMRLRRQLAELKLAFQDATIKLAQYQIRASVIEYKFRVLQVDNEQLALERDLLKSDIRVLADELERIRNELNKLVLPDRLEIALSQIAQGRENLLETISDKLSDLGIKVTIDLINGVIRFDEDVIQFASGSAKLGVTAEQSVDKIAIVFEEVLRCYVLGNSSQPVECDNANAVIETLQIEGHTDTVGSAQNNLALSTARAVATYSRLIQASPALQNYRNANYIVGSGRLLPGEDIPDIPGETILSVSGYGEDRRLHFNDDNSDKRQNNRRIDIRFIMTAPRNTRQLDALELALQRAL